MLKQSKILSLPENIDAPLWRYMSIEKLESLLKESALYFRRADLFEDPLEGNHSAATIKNRPSFFAGATDSWINKTMPMFDARTRKCVYVNCWHNNSTESAYMWDKYTSENKGIAIKSSLNRIRRAILDTEREFLINPVRYINYEKDYTSDANSFYAFFCKEESYINEKEVRFAFDQNSERIGDADFDSLPLDEGVFIPVDNNLLIEKVVISPHTKDDDIHKIKSLLDEYKLGDKLQHNRIAYSINEVSMENLMNVEIFALCDAATDSQGKLNILGAFDTIFSEQMPSVHPQCAVAIRMRINHIDLSDHNISLRIRDEDGGDLIPAIQGNFNINSINFGADDQTAAVNLIFNIQSLQLKRFGEASINFDVDGKELSTIPLRIKKI